jgi:tripartite-type tricarboxylate transporter receptor subunit TctC
MHRRHLLLATLGAAAARPAFATAVPGDIRMIVPFAAGGATDLLARRLQAPLEPHGVKLVVENATGGGSMVGMSKLLASRADGRTLGMASQGLIAQIAYGEIPLRLDQFTPLARVAIDPLVLLTGANSRFRTLDDVITAMRAPGGGPSIGAAGPVGTLGNLRALALAQEVKGEMTYIGYPGASRVANELIGGHLDLGVAKPNDVFGQIRSGQIRVLAVLDDVGIKQLPEVPTATSRGIDIHRFGRMTAMTYVAAPAGLDAAMREALVTTLRAAILSPDYQAKADSDGYIADALSGPALEAAIAETFAAAQAAQARARG